MWSDIFWCYMLLLTAYLLVASVANLWRFKSKDVLKLYKIVTYLGHRKLALETAPHPVVNTLGFPPCLLHALVTIGLVAPENKRNKTSETQNG